MKRIFLPVGLVLAVLTARTIAQIGPADRLDVQATQLVGCPDGHPFFRVALNPVSADGRSAGVQLRQTDLKTAFKVVEVPSGQDLPVVSVTASSSGTKGSKGNYILLLLDTSGSMNASVARGQTRFEAALAAIRQALPAFNEGTDHLAVADFDSHRVVDRITRATASVRPASQVGADVDQISRPKPTNDTALYSAVAEGLDVLRRRSDDGYVVSLIVFSDGENDIRDASHQQDRNDSGLLGDEGLEKVKAMAAQFKVPVITVGFGITGNVRAVTAMQAMAWPTARNYHDASTNARILTDILGSTRQTLADQIQILFDPRRSARTDLAAASLKFHVTTAPPAPRLESRADAAWIAPASVAPSFDARCTPDEAEAIANYTKGVDASPQNPVFNRLLILIGFGGLLATLWFGAPRFVWPDRYVPKPQFQVPSTGSMMPPIDRPRMPSPPSSYVPSMPSPPASPGDHTVFVPPRGQAPPAPRTVPQAPPDRPRPRDGGDETVYVPPKNPRRDH